MTAAACRRRARCRCLISRGTDQVPRRNSGRARARNRPRACTRLHPSKGGAENAEGALPLASDAGAAPGRRALRGEARPRGGAGRRALYRGTGGKTGRGRWSQMSRRVLTRVGRCASCPWGTWTAA
ncbi:hypothetical protein HJG60_009440 [Phyllostomus discolor]|uniref:Uncharacterized protein n=1 Tax=Phyllostomus discolor TaxID=89673 RepID=A0A834DCS6_9CHIR|nr:hypothetical protein HJG60_009440 [Phyllostomus discolor]